MLKAIALLIALSVAILAVAGCQPQEPPPAPTDSPLVFGQTVNGKLGQREARWLFAATRGDLASVEFSVVGQADLPVVAIVDPSGNSVARISPTTGRLDKFRLPVEGQYAIVVGGGDGYYTLTLRRAQPDPTSAAKVTPTAPPAGKPIAPGQEQTGTLETGDAQDLWTFSGNTGDVLTIRVVATGGDLDPLLRLFGPDGTLVASDNDSAGDHNAQIGGVRLPETGTYFLRVSGKGRTGDYSLRIDNGTLIQTPTPSPMPTAILPTVGPSPTPTATPTSAAVAVIGTQVRVGQTVYGNIQDAQQVDRFAVFGPAGTTISVGMFPQGESKMVPSFVMYAPNGEQVGQAAGAGSAIVSGYTLPATGAYIIYARALRGETTGQYALTVGDGFNLRDIDRGAPSTDGISQGLLARIGDREIWSLSLPAGTTFNVEIASDQTKFDTILEIIAPDGKLLNHLPAAPATHGLKSPQITTTQNGKYLFRISAAKPGTTGTYVIAARVLKVQPTATVNTVQEQTVTAEVDEGGTYTYTLMGASGEVVFVDVRERAVGGFDPVIEIYGPSGRRLAVADDVSGDSTQAILQISLDDGTGAYSIQVHGYAMTPGAFTMHLKTN